MSEKIIKNYLDDALYSFRNYKELAEKAMNQVSDEEFFRALDEESNSIAVTVKHITGNLRSRWTDFLTSDGEKPDRLRDAEFVSFATETRASLTANWENAWQILFATLNNLRVEDFDKTITIRGQKHTICEAINRQLTHYAYHIGQIAFSAKHFRSQEWQTLSVPRNKSADFNAFLATKTESGNRYEQVAEFSRRKDL